MSVPILTIPEGAYDLSSYTSTPLQYNRRKSRLLGYLINLTHGSAITLVVLYIIGLFVLKPLLETKTERHYEFLEYFRGKLRDCYLNLVGRVSYIPIVAINKNGKLYADAIVQTDDSYKRAGDAEEADKLSQTQLLKKFKKLNKTLGECISYQVSEIPHYKTTNFAIKDFQNKADIVYFNSNDLFSVDTPVSMPAQTESKSAHRKRNLSTDIKNDIRSIKGLFMSGQA